MSQVPKYYVKVMYNGVDISSDITTHLINLRYVDNVHGKSDEIDITLEDGDAKWRNEWYPKKGDLLTVTIGPDADSTFEAGVFWIDEIEIAGPPDTIVIRGLATGAKGILNTKNSSAHEGKTLKAIAGTIAKNNGLTINDGSLNYTTNTPYNLKQEAYILRVDSRVLIDLTSLTDNEVQQGLARIQTDLANISASLKLKQALKELAEVKTLAQSFISLYAGLDISDGSNGAARNVALLKESTYMSNLAAEFLTTSGISSQTTIKSGVLDGIVINRSTQNHETDLGFLKRICNEYGIIFSIRNATLFFTTVFKLEALPAAFTINRNQLKSYQFADKIHKVYKSAKVAYHDPGTADVVESEFDTQEETNADGETYMPDTSDDVLVIHSKSETKEQADIKAQAALHAANSKAKDGSITVDGNAETVLILAGNNFEITGNGAMSGKWHVITSTHEISAAGGYEITANIKVVGTVPKAENKSAAIPSSFNPHNEPAPSASFNQAVNGFRAGVIQ